MSSGSTRDFATGREAGQAPSELLIAVIQELSLARDLDTVMQIVRRAARELTGADGATFVLREGDHCFYADEDAIRPLWKGHRFPLSTCISGWVMQHGEAAVIEDIYADPRIPVEVYRPTFVKSLAMVPVRSKAPIAAIGNYWAARHHAGPEQLRLLQALADSTSIAMENVQLYGDLQERVAARTRELEAFSYSVSHDLRGPLRAVDGYSGILEEDYAEVLDATARDYLRRTRTAVARMHELMDGLLLLSRVTRREMAVQEVDLSGLARQIAAELAESDPDREVEWAIAPDLAVRADPGLLRILLQNLLGNAHKFTAGREPAVIEVGREATEEGRAFYVRDNGAGFDMRHAESLFQPFQRLHAVEEFSGTGIGLATVHRIIERHGGRVWPDSAPGAGTTLYFQFP